LTFDEQQLIDLFSQYGDVVQARLLRDQSTTFSRRVGFVIMATKPMAQTAIQNLDNTVPSNATEPIYVKYADEEGKKRHGSHNHGMNNNNNNNIGGGRMNNIGNNFNFNGNNNNGNNNNPFNMIQLNHNNSNQLNPINAMNSLHNLGKL
jgi:RNA recognition motif-containing protein